jgi:hypothetical protein
MGRLTSLTTMRTSMSSGNSSDERNPFAPPPEDAPDQPWRPRFPQGPAGDGAEGDGGAPGGGPRPQVPPQQPWGPSRQDGGPGRQSGPQWQGGGPGWPPQAPQPPRFDPNDPVHRRSRYALAGGMAAMFCGLTEFLELALLFGALALYWGVSALRATGKEAPTGAAAAGATGSSGPQQPAPNTWSVQHTPRPQLPAALGGLLTGGVAVMLVLGSFGIQFAYRPYFTCVNDALTNVAEQSCSNLAPQWIVDMENPQN